MHFLFSWHLNLGGIPAPRVLTLIDSLSIMKVYLNLMLTGLLMLLSSGMSRATHIRTADITAERICGTALTFRITITAYLNSKSNTRFGGGNGPDDGSIHFGDGEIALIPSGLTPVPRTDLGVDISVVTYTIDHTFQSSGMYTISYFERDRSAGVINIPGSIDIPYVSQIRVNATNDFGCNHTPRLLIAPVDRACSGTSFSHSPGAVDADGDSLSYTLTTPKGFGFNPVNGYQHPASPAYYDNFSTGNETADGPPTFAIDEETGEITWNAPGRLGEYNIAFIISEWRKHPTTGEAVLLSATTRDMQIIVEQCENLRPDFSLFPNNICVEAGTTVQALIKGVDPEKKNVKIEVVSDAFEFPASQKPATYSPNPPVFQPTGVDPAEVSFKWETDCFHVRQQPYQLVFKITDDPPHGSPLVTFRTWTIRIVAPAPKWEKASVDLVKRHGVLEWQKYTCTNASKIQVWRKVGSNAFVDPACKTGITPYSGYSMIGEVDASENTFIDTNGAALAAGALYCYRLVAVFGTSPSTMSRVSNEICIGPIEADAPIITNVTVEETQVRGKIRVSWRSPFYINTTQFPGPYQYEIYRANGFAGDTNIVSAGFTTDTTFVDHDINTCDSVFNYRVVVYSPTQGSTTSIPVDTSAVASLVRLSAIGSDNTIALMWRDSVPWSNIIPGRAWHYIYRGESESDLKLIDSTNVEVHGKTFTDSDVDSNTLYYYKVKTVGTYGNPLIEEQHNFSQIFFVYPENDLFPCAPRASIVLTDCQTFIETNACGATAYTNSISWSTVDAGDCRMDILTYNVYAADNIDGEFKLIASDVADTTFLDEGLPSFARCYRVAAVDSKGQESDPSDPVCNDNCPYFDVPNVFTPNGDGCNDVFSASEAAQGPCGTAAIVKCSRFIKQITFHVYNRWGKEVYSFTSGNGNPVTIDWNGRDKSGAMLEPAVYYYIADVTFDRVDPLVQRQRYKGWVQLIH